jgi:exopolysaccharide biosynthesis polyprenyl glycosylphosphotransferase
MRHAGAAVRADDDGARAPARSRDGTSRTVRTTLIPTTGLGRAGEAGDHPAARSTVATPCRQLLAGATAPQRVLVIGDALTVLFAFYVVIMCVARVGPGSWQELAFQATLVTATALAAMRSQDLWESRLNSVRSIELARITRAVVLMGLGTIVLDRGVRLYVHVEEIALGCATVWIALVGWRSTYRTWLGVQRTAGRFRRRVLIIGTDRRAMDLADLFETHPETGVEVVGIVGSAREARTAGRSHLWRANYADADRVLAAADVDGVVLCSSDINPALLDGLIRDEQRRDRELYLDPGLSGIDFRRVQALPIAHQPLLYVESPSLSRLQVACKRGFDVAMSLGMLVALSPVLLAVAAAIALTDRGPVLFRQRRVGRDGVPFEILKFRSMCVDAEARLAALRAEQNERTGPLFKLDRDPRVTAVGRFIRAFSLDELPQLLNVLRGEMSLVGPRPALPAEVAAFPADLHARHLVRPGITGLWQVEARDNPSFGAYRRLDLFYVGNWSLLLDLIILLGTVEQVLVRPFMSRLAAAPGPARELPIAA